MIEKCSYCDSPDLKYSKGIVEYDGNVSKVVDRIESVICMECKAIVFQRETPMEVKK